MFKPPVYGESHISKYSFYFLDRMGIGNGSEEVYTGGLTLEDAISRFLSSEHHCSLGIVRDEIHSCGLLFRTEEGTWISKDFIEMGLEHDTMVRKAVETLRERFGHAPRDSF